MPELSFKIKTVGDLKALEDTKAGLEASRKATVELGKDTSVLESEIKKVDAALQSESASAVRSAEGLKKAIASTKAAKGDTAPMKAELEKVQKQFDLPGRNPVGKAGDFVKEAASKLPGADTFKSIFNGSAGTVAGVGAAFTLAAKGVDEFAEAQKRNTGLDAALAQNGLLTDQYREKLQALEGELQKTTGVADDKWAEVLKRLTQFGSKPETIGMDVEAVKNLAGLLGGDVQAAAEAYSKALEGQFEMFSRMGIKLDENASKTEKLKQLQEQAAQRGGGQLEASNRTLIGQYEQLKNNVADIFEAFGRWIAQTGTLQKVLYGLAYSAGWVAEQIGGVVPKVEGLKNALASKTLTVEETERAMKKYGQELQEQTALSKAYEEALIREVAAIQRKQRAQDELIDADMAGKLAAVDTQEQLKKITPAQAIRQRSEIKANAANDKRFTAMKAAADTITALQAEQKREEEKMATASGALDESKAAKAQMDAYEKARKKAFYGAKDVEYIKNQIEGMAAFEKAGFSTAGLPTANYDTGLGVTYGRDTQERDGGLARSYRIGMEKLNKMLAEAEASRDAKLAEVDKNAPAPEVREAAGKLGDRQKAFTELSPNSQTRINQIADAIQAAKDKAPQLELDMFRNPELERYKSADAIHKAQREAIGEPLPEGSKVTPHLASEYQMIGSAEVNQRKLLLGLSDYLKKNGYVNEQMLVQLEAAQRALDALAKKVEREQTRANFNRR